MLVEKAKELLGSNISFLPMRTPESRIPPEFRKYEDACLDMPNHYPIDKGGVRGWLDKEFQQFEPSLINHLSELSIGELRYLNVLLVILAHCYRWESSPPPCDAAKQTQLSLPDGIGKLWPNVCLLTEQKQVGTNATMFYWNWRLNGKGPNESYSLDELSIEKIETINYWLSDEHNKALDRWVGIFVMTEATGTVALKALMNAADAAEREDSELVSFALIEARESIQKMVRIFGETVKITKFDPSNWQKIIQPTYAWGIESHEGRLTGPSGMQIGSMQGISILLGIRAKSDVGILTTNTQKRFTAPQQLFLKILMQKSDIIRRFVSESGDGKIVENYNDCVNELARWRNSHMKRAAMYIEKAGVDVNSSRISTGLTLPAVENQKQIFVDEMSQRIEETRQAIIGSSSDLIRIPEGALLPDQVGITTV